MKKSIIIATIDKEENVNVDLHWENDKELYFIVTSLFSTLIKTIGKEKILELVEEGDKLKITEEKCAVENLKIFKVDDYYTVVAKDLEEAKKFYYSEEICGDPEDEFEGCEIEGSSKMWFPNKYLPKEFQVKPFEVWEGDECSCIPLKIAMQYRADKAPYILSISSDLI